jgi:phospholipase C
VTSRDGAHSFDHVVSVMFENRLFDSLYGHPYEPGGGVVRACTRPRPIQFDSGLRTGAERGVVPVHAATSMDTPNPDAGEEHPHANTQSTALTRRMHMAG